MLGRQCGRGRTAEAHARQHVARRRLALEQVGDDRRHDVDPGAALRGDELPEGLGRELRRHREAAAMRQRRQHGHRKGVDVIQRQHGRDAVVRAEPVLGADRLRVRGEVGLREHHALGLAGRARGVHEQGQRIGARRRRHRVNLGLAGQRGGIGIDDQHVDAPFDTGEQRPHALLPIRCHAHQLSVRVIEHVTHLLGLRQQVDRVHAPAAVERTEQQPDRLQAVAHDQRDVGARREAARRQQRADVAARLREGAEVEALAGVRRDEVGRARSRRGLCVDERADRLHLSAARRPRSSRRRSRPRSARARGSARPRA